MHLLIKSTLDMWAELLPWTVGFFILFGVLAKVMPCNPGQRFWRKDTLTDIIYLFGMPVVTRFVRIGFFSAGIYFVFRGESDQSINNYLTHGFGPLGHLAIWQQAALVFVIEDIILYWTHRMFHSKRLWNFHAIHHSSEHVDWLSTYRFHPINTWFSFTLVDCAMMLSGFSPDSVAVMAGVNMIYSAMVHANLNWTFGPFRYLFASPVFHRWHHTAQEEGMDKNFAPTFPLLDIMFGTFYMPDRLPTTFGVAGEDIPHGFVDQMFWPFKRYGKK